ncbi:MAG: Clp amino terminal domain, pathogenicity island component [Thermoleophilia bacterium]|nr:Clp amino terminal domain, pathogenicity island component [Thermoleophilia bacterium]MCZ4496189.1 Clp amino terminal domain, pathogenicity island component [Thermoleophilia bacterium]
MEMTERAWHVIREARREAKRLGDEHVGTDHILLAMLRDADGAGADVLADFDVDYGGVFARLAGEPTAAIATRTS